MRVWDGSGTGQIHFSAASVHAEALGHIVENRVVQDALLDALRAGGEVELLGNASLQTLERDGTGWQIELADGRRIRSSWWSRPMARNRRCVV